MVLTDKYGLVLVFRHTNTVNVTSIWRLPSFTGGVRPQTSTKMSHIVRYDFQLDLFWSTSI